MKILLLPLAALVPMVVLAAAPKFYTWKGGAGRWDDPSMWTVDDGAVGGYPHDDSLDTAVFPTAVEADVTIPDGTTVSNLLILAENSNVRFVAPAGCTNAMTYRAFRVLDEATGEWIGACGANATFALERVRLQLKIGDKTGRLFAASTSTATPALKAEVESRTLDGPKDGSVVRLADGAYLSMLMNSNTGKDKERIVWDILGGAELHVHRWTTGWYHRHVWTAADHVWPQASLPSLGYWGDIGWAEFRTTPVCATLTLRQSDFFFPRPVGWGVGGLAARPPEWDDIVASHAQATCTFRLS